MRPIFRSAFGAPLLALVSLLGAAIGVAATVPAAAPAVAQPSTAYTVSLQQVSALADGGVEVALMVEPGTSRVSALGVEISYDSATTSITACQTSAALAACNIDTPGLVRAAVVDPSGWDGLTELLRVTVNSPETVQPESFALRITDALNVRGDQISGSVAGLLPLVGDVSCNRAVDLIDAVMIAQHVVSTRSASQSCPLGDAATQLNIAVADLDGSGSVTLADAVLVAECAFGTANAFCPG